MKIFSQLTYIIFKFIQVRYKYPIMNICDLARDKGPVQIRVICRYRHFPAAWVFGESSMEIRCLRHVSLMSSAMIFVDISSKEHVEASDPCQLVKYGDTNRLYCSICSHVHHEYYITANIRNLVELDDKSWSDHESQNATFLETLEYYDRIYTKLACRTSLLCREADIQELIATAHPCRYQDKKFYGCPRMYFSLLRSR